MTRYVIKPGPVFSKTDEQTHHVTAPELIRLYGLKPEQCIIVDERDRTKVGFKPRKDDVYLHPRANGDYTLPKRGVFE